MERSEVISDLRDYVAEAILDGKDIGLDASTPLLEWGIINSMEIGELIVFIQSRFGIGIPDHKILPNHFVNLTAIADLVVELDSLKP